MEHKQGTPEDDVVSVALHPVVTIYRDGTFETDWEASFVACYNKDGDEVDEVRYVPLWGLRTLELMEVERQT
jgi:hypothetical protein